MDFVALECLVVLGDEQHFGRAARRLHRSTSALSRMVAQLEQRLGAELVVRTREGVRLTPVGTRVRASAEALLAEHRRAPLLAQHRHEAATLTWRVGVSYGSPPAFQRLVAERLRTGTGGRREVVLAPDASSRVIDRVRRGELELGVVHAPAATDGLATWPLHSYTWQVAVRADDPLAGRPSVTVEDLDPRRILGPPFHCGPASLEALNRRLAQAGRSPLVWPSRDPAGAVHLLLRVNGQMPVPAVRYGGWSLMFDVPWVRLVPLTGPGPDVRLVLVADDADRLLPVRDAASDLQRAFAERWSR